MNHLFSLKQQIFQFNGIINKTVVMNQEGRGTGGILWPTTELFSNYLLSSSFQPMKYFNLQNKEEIIENEEKYWNWEEKVVLEIGSGLGLTSIILASLGSKVISTDGELTVVDQLSNNFDLNSDKNLRNNVVSCVYRWGDSLNTILDTLNNNEQIFGRDWIKSTSYSSSSSASSSLLFDIILATDVVYGEDVSIWSFLQHSLQLSASSLSSSSPTQTSIILIAQTERYPEKEKLFFNQMNELFVLRDVIDISGTATCSLNNVNVSEDNEQNEKHQHQQMSYCKLYVYTK